MEKDSLVQRLRRREERAYEELIEEYGRLLWTVVSGILVGQGSREDAEEVVSDVFAELWKHPERFDPARGTIRSYLCIRARSMALDRLRALCRVALIPLDEAEPQVEDLAENLLASCTVHRIQELLNALNSPEREILTLRLLYDMKSGDIGKKLGLPMGTVYEKTRSGKEKLAAQLRKEGFYE